MRGEDLIAAIRRTDGLTRTAVVVTTGAPDQIDGSDLVLRKPFSLDALLEAVERFAYLR
jgi:hypothetical protein